MSNLAAVGIWASHGVTAFPCNRETKKPTIKGWRSLREPEKARRVWAQFRDAMPGLDCESVGIVVIDCDIDATRGLDGVTSFYELCEASGVAAPDAPQVITPRGGRHLYFRQPLTGAPLKNSASTIAPGVDVRGVGGFVVVAGAIRADGRKYMVDDRYSLDEFIGLVAERALPVLADDLADLIRARSARAKASFGPSRYAGSGVACAGVAGGIAEEDELVGGIRNAWNLERAALAIEQAPEGGRNHALNREAVYRRDENHQWRA